MFNSEFSDSLSIALLILPRTDVFCIPRPPKFQLKCLPGLLQWCVFPSDLCPRSHCSHHFEQSGGTGEKKKTSAMAWQLLFFLQGQPPSKKTSPKGLGSFLSKNGSKGILRNYIVIIGMTIGTLETKTQSYATWQVSAVWLDPEPARPGKESISAKNGELPFSSPSISKKLGSVHISC